MEGDFRSDLTAYPSAHGPDFLRAIVEAGDDEVDQFKPDLGLVDGLDSLENRLQLAADIVFIKVFREGLQVNLDGLDNLGQFKERFLADMPTGDDTVFDSPSASFDRGVIHIFIEDHRLGICIGNGGTAIF